MKHGKAAQESITLRTATGLLPKNAPCEILPNICIVQRDLCSNVEDNAMRAMGRQAMGTTVAGLVENIRLPAHMGRIEASL